MGSKQDSTGGTTPTKGKAVQVVAGVGGVRSSEEAVPDLWFGQNTEERRDATCSAGWRRNSELVTAHQGYKRQESSGIAIPHWRYRPLVGIERNPESRMRENRLSGLMRGGGERSLAFVPVSPCPCLLYTDCNHFWISAGTFPKGRIAKRRV